MKEPRITRADLLHAFEDCFRDLVKTIKHVPLEPIASTGLTEDSFGFSKGPVEGLFGNAYTSRKGLFAGDKHLEVEIVRLGSFQIDTQIPFLSIESTQIVSRAYYCWGMDKEGRFWLIQFTGADGLSRHSTLTAQEVSRTDLLSLGIDELAFIRALINCCPPLVHRHKENTHVNVLGVSSVYGRIQTIEMLLTLLDQRKAALAD